MNTLKSKSAMPLITDWSQIDWQKINRYVEKSQQRIYHAERAGDKRKVRNLQRMLMNSELYLGTNIPLSETPHPQKGWKWIKRQHFKPDKTGQSMDKWILTDSVTGNQLKKMAWTPIVRHQQVKYNYSPFDADLKEYFNKRDRNKFDLNNVAYRQKLAKKQKCVCPMCGMSITDFEEGLETHHILPVVKGGTGTYKNLQLVHISCHIEYHRVFPAKGDVPTPSEIAKCHKGIKGKRLAGTL